ncbi:hypothetical protein C2E23DRAFT_739037 [Lenzites betulinus]|nr:hypothetical protein C2E23DRAFT_739037 [Lenzites betulinus]
MSRTARLLRLPMSTAPLSAMADVHWPSLETLSLSGSFSRDKAGQVTNCPSYLFTHTPNLRDLTITAALHQTSNARASVLGRDASPRNVLRRLHSLKLAYPDPEDAIFSIDAAPLVHLSLRDWPRHYEIPGPPSNRNQWRSPILTASEALSILRRIRTADIGTLELVYAADAVDPELLAFIARALPSLKHLELHRYRQDTEIDVDYRSISRTLSTVETLVSLRLNLDFGGDPGPHSIESIHIAAERWYPRLANIGWDILGIVKACPLLEHVMLLYHGHPPSLSRWLCFSRSNHATREIVSGSSDCVL